MIEPQQVTIYCAAYDGTSGLSHRLLRQAAQLSAPAQTDLTLASGTHGKPYFLHAPQLHFNLSHSGRHWLCAFSGAPVGLDVQQHRACQKQALARRFFSPAECAFLERTAYVPFFDLWCAKESYLKYLGRGLCVPLDSFCVRLDENDASLQAPGASSALRLHEYTHDGCRICLCTKSPRPPLQLYQP